MIRGGPMTQQEAADLMAVSRATWSLWERDARGMAEKHLRRWLEVCEPYRMWELVLADDGVNVSGIKYIVPDRALDAASKLQIRTEATGQPLELVLPDSSELEARANATDQS